MNNNIPQGYKESPLGVIPQDWEVLPMKQIVRYVSGGAFSSKDATTTGVRWLKIANVGVNVIKWDEQSYLPTSLIADYPQCELRQGDVVLALTRPILNGVLKISYIKESDTPALLNQRVAKLNELNGFSRRYIYYSMQTPRFVAQMESDMLGTDPPNASFESMYRQKITVPPLVEQERIAEVLGTWDEAIDKQSQLVKALERRKRALMQQLLTARKRLPNFSTPWQRVKLGKICKISTGKLDANAAELNGEYPFFTCAKKPFRINKFAFDTEAILVAGNGEHLGYVHYFNGKFNAYQRTYILDEISENIFFIMHYLQKHLKSRINKTKSSSNTPYIVLSSLSDMELKLPKIEEQKAIAQILTTADKEIDLATKKLDTLRTQKRALMQQLLTGKKRLKI